MADNVDIKDKKRAHKERHSGRKAEKKKEKDKHVQDLTPEQKNPKAFTFRSSVKAERQFRRNQDITAKKQRLPWVDRTPVDPPPFIVAIVGPPKVGKTTLMKSLLRNYTRQKITSIQGPVTLVIGKKRRLTVIECSNDINCMIDIAKVADLVLVMVDASFGFEMETFEFLNICQVHGFPRIMGVLTHLDLFRNDKKLRARKKLMKHRFWKDVYQGAKLFYLSGLVRYEYYKTEIRNLSRFISYMKPKQLIWRRTHPHILADRMEDLTNQEDIRQNPKCNRTVCLYGYVRGSQLKNHLSLHIPGCGDVKIHDISHLKDPCPLPETEKKRNLIEKERLIYAPMSGLGGIVYDKDAVYIELGSSKKSRKQDQEIEPTPNQEMMSSIIDTQETIDEKIAKSELHLFKGSAPMSATGKELNTAVHMPQEQLITEDSGRVRRKVVFDEDDEELLQNSVDMMDDDEDDEEIDGYSLQTRAKKRKLETNDEELVFENSDEDEEALDMKGKMSLPLRTHQEDRHDWTKRRRRESEEEDPTRRLQKSLSEFLGEEDDVEEEEEEEGNTVRGEQEFSDYDKRYSESGSETDEEGDTDKETPKPESSKQESMNEVPSYHKASVSARDREIYTKITKTLSKFQKRNITGAEEYVDKSEMKNKGSELDEDEGMEEEGIRESIEKESNEGFVDDAEEVLGLKWKDNLAKRAADSYYQRQSTSSNIKRLVYEDGDDDSDTEAEDKEGVDADLGGLFRIARQKQKQKHSHKTLMDEMDCSKFTVSSIQDWELEEVREQIRDCFVTGVWKESEDAEELLRLDDEDSDVDGDFEDMETGEIHKSKTEERTTNEKQEEEVSQKVQEKEEKTKKEKRIEKKRKLKQMFNAAYDEAGGDKNYYDELKQEMIEQAELNRVEFMGIDDQQRIQYEGYRPGMYVRVEVESMPCEFVTNFDATYPIILGGLTAGEENVGYVQVRLKKHRWHQKILKTRDPVIFSLGWRRFQSIPLYCIQDHNMRQRLLKYTPEHLHCNAHFWGPITPQNTGILAIQSVSENTSNFRIAATGTVVDLDKSTQLMKKLKLTGYPFKVFKNTAFIQGMFTSALEVAKFEGAAIRTVSGIRGQIKKGLSKPEGAFRAKFEDNVLLRDIVFVRTWYSVEVPRFYSPVTSLLLPMEEKTKWQGMKTLGQLKREKEIKTPSNEDSTYTPIVREPPVFKPLVIPKSLQRDLPYEDKPKLPPKKKKTSAQQQRIAVVREPHETEIANLMKMIKATYEDRKEKKQQSNIQHGQVRLKQKQAQMEESTRRYKVLRKEVFRTLSKMEKKHKKPQK